MIGNKKAAENCGLLKNYIQENLFLTECDTTFC